MLMNTIISYLLANLLIGGSIVLGFLLTSRFIIYVNTEDSLSDEEDKGIHLNSFIEELDNEPMSNLSEEELDNLKNLTVCLNLSPLKNQDIRMFYDYKLDQFIYYSDSDLIYKYLDIVARYYILTYHCKQIYVELEESIVKTIEKKVETVGPFISKKNDKTLLEKKHLHFLYKGNYQDYLRDKDKSDNITEKKEINILEFMKLKNNEDLMKED